MTKLSNEWSGVELAENMLLMVYPFTIGDANGVPKLRQPFRSLETLTVTAFSASLAEVDAAAEEGGATIWETVVAEQAKKHLSPDLHPIVDRILHGGNAAPGRAGGEQYLPYRVRRDFMKDEFVIELPSAAAKRLKKAGASAVGSHYIRFRFQDINAYLMPTGIGLLTMEIEIKAPLDDNGGKVSADLLLEGIYALSHPANRKQSIRHGKLQKKTALEVLSGGDKAHIIEAVGYHGTLEEKNIGLKKSLGASLGAAERRGYSVLVGAEQGERCLVLQEGAFETTTLGQLAEALLGGVTDSCEHARFFSFAYARTKAGVTAGALRELAFRLSGNYNCQYAVSPVEERRHTRAIFSNVHFAATLQGGAVVVSADGEEAPEHLRNYYDNAVKCSYIPLGLLAYHEYLQLKILLATCAVPCTSADLESEAARIKEARDRILNFRLYYRFSHVSDMAHHNTVHSTWRSALALDTMLQELSTDMAEADNVYKAAVESRKAQREHEREERWKWASTIVAAFGAFTFIHELFEIILRLFFTSEEWLLLLFKGDGVTAEALKHNQKYASVLEFHHFLQIGEVGIAIVAGILAIGAGCIAWKKGPKLGHH